jgi:predicted PurR-regulated permease PerM
MESAAVRAAAVTVVTAGIIAALYYGQVLFIPIALAILISFVLAPVVRGFERLGLNRVLSVLAVGLVTYTALGATAWIITIQATGLVQTLPGYRANIRQKIADVRALGRGRSVERLQETFDEAAREPKHGPHARGRAIRSSWSASPVGTYGVCPPCSPRG